MRKLISFLFTIAIAISACLSPSGGSAQPQVTVTSPPQTSEVFETSEVSPTPTLHPQFISLQETIAASGGRFTLTPQGFIEDNGTPIPGLTVAPDGVMTLIVNGESVQIDPADVTFDDENGISIDGYELDENGEWVESNTAIPAEELAAMSDEQKLDSAPELEGREKELRSAHVYYRDADGNITDSFDLLDGEMEEGSGAVLTAQADFDKYGYDYADLTFGESEEGIVTAADENGGILYQDGKYNFNYAVEQAYEQDLMSTNIEPDKKVLEGSGQYVVDDRGKANEDYFHPLQARVKKLFMEIYGFDPYNNNKAGLSRVMIDPEINAWGSTLKYDYYDPESDEYLFYELEDGAIHIVPLL